MKPLGTTVALLLTLLVAGCQRADPVYNGRFLAFGTLVDLTISGVPHERAEAARTIIEQDFQQMHRAWHAWDPGPLGRVNLLLETTLPFSAPPSIIPLIIRGQELSARSNGLFNPAIARLIGAWGFHRDDPDGHHPPSPKTIARLLRQNPQMSDILLDGIQLRSTNPSVKLDFGAFGKGYGIDLAIRHLRELGIENAILNAGGDLQTIGSRNGRPWRIAIRHPSGDGVIATIESKGDEGIFTSGDYEKNFTWKGKRYHHIIDPRTGYPATGTTSVTVIHPDATTADAAATALFIAGPAQWHQVAERMGIRYVLLIDSEGTLHMTPGMKERLTLLDRKKRIRISSTLNLQASVGS